MVGLVSARATRRVQGDSHRWVSLRFTHPTGSYWFPCLLAERENNVGEYGLLRPPLAGLAMTGRFVVPCYGTVPCLYPCYLKFHQI